MTPARPASRFASVAAPVAGLAALGALLIGASAGAPGIVIGALAGAVLGLIACG